MTYFKTIFFKMKNLRYWTIIFLIFVLLHHWIKIHMVVNQLMATFPHTKHLQVQGSSWLPHQKADGFITCLMPNLMIYWGTREVKDKSTRQIDFNHQYHGVLWQRVGSNLNFVEEVTKSTHAPLGCVYIQKCLWS